MQTGMLWFDNDAKTALAAKVERAAAYYQQKYGQRPDVCLVHPSMLTGSQPEGKLTIRPSRSILPGHLWVGVEEKQ